MKRPDTARCSLFDFVQLLLCSIITMCFHMQQGHPHSKLGHPRFLAHSLRQICKSLIMYTRPLLRLDYIIIIMRCASKGIRRASKGIRIDCPQISKCDVAGAH